MSDNDARSLDLRDFGLTAADLNAAADLLYAPGDARFEPLKRDHETQARYGRIRSGLRNLADALEASEHEYGGSDVLPTRLEG